jgi:hypothetical protein
VRLLAPTGAIGATAREEKGSSKRRRGGKKMPFDATDLDLFENHPLAKLGAVERLLATEQQWCKGKLRDSSGRHCLVGAMQAVEARQMLEPIILRAAREVGGKCYWRIEFFNDDPRTTHADVLRVLRRARENIIAGMIEGDRHRSWRQRLAQAARALCSGSLTEACAAFRFGADAPGALAGGGSPPPLQTPSKEAAPAAREVCKVS